MGFQMLVYQKLTFSWILIIFFLYLFNIDYSVVAPLKKHEMLTKEDEKVLEQELWDKGLRVPTYWPSPEKQKELTEYPDAKKHQIVSFIKSGIRILGYIVIPFDLVIAAGILVFSEVIGIIEELV